MLFLTAQILLVHFSGGSLLYSSQIEKDDCIMRNARVEILFTLNDIQNKKIYMFAFEENLFCIV